MSRRILAVSIAREPDVVLARQRARQIAGELGFDATEQTRIATAVSEIVRNAYAYATGGTVEFRVDGDVRPQLLVIQVVDRGPGIAELEEVLSGAYKSPTGLGLGIIGARRLVDQLDVVSTPGSGTSVTLKKLLPRRAPECTPAHVAAIASRLAAQRPASALEEMQLQNQELLRTLDELRGRQDELLRVNRELEDTNRGVVALYAELDERADHLRRADELKSRFLSNMTHEFRTPVNSILALTDLLADRLRIPPDQKGELFYIRKAAEQLAEIVDDLLDLAKVEAGKTTVRPAPFEVAGLFSALRGMLRPLLVQSAVSLVFEEPDGLPRMVTDETKVSQILRNFISNALKYTERGEVRVSARLIERGDAIVFEVSDTGIGIAEKDLPRIFDEFVQIENPLQRRVKGTGLGLPLSRRLAELLGGSVAVRSTVGVGSIFTVTLPLIYRSTAPKSAIADVSLDPERKTVLVVEDNVSDTLLYTEYLDGSPFQMIAARTAAEAEELLAAITPAAIILDIRLFGEDAWDLLVRLKQQGPKAVPVIVVSSQNESRKGLALGADAYGVKPVARTWLLQTLRSVTGTTGRRVLVIDDEESSRFVAARMMPAGVELIEAANGAEGLQLAAEHQPDAIVLDLLMPDLSGYDVLERLREQVQTASIPVIVLSSVDALDRERLTSVSTVLNKRTLTREALVEAVNAATSGDARMGRPA